MKAPLLIPFLAAGFLLVGCSDTPPTEPTRGSVEAGVHFDLLNGPEVPGQSHLFRFSADETWMLSASSDQARLFTTYGDPNH